MTFIDQNLSNVMQPEESKLLECRFFFLDWRFFFLFSRFPDVTQWYGAGMCDLGISYHRMCGSIPDVDNYQNQHALMITWSDSSRIVLYSYGEGMPCCSECRSSIFQIRCTCIVVIYFIHPPAMK